MIWPHRNRGKCSFQRSIPRFLFAVEQEQDPEVESINVRDQLRPDGLPESTYGPPKEESSNVRALLRPEGLPASTSGQRGHEQEQPVNSTSNPMKLLEDRSGRTTFAWPQAANAMHLP